MLLPSTPHAADLPAKPGTHRRPCPDCNRSRRDTALAITRKGDGSLVWFCHRCGMRGGSTGEHRQRFERVVYRDREQIASDNGTRNRPEARQQR